MKASPHRPTKALIHLRSYSTKYSANGGSYPLRNALVVVKGQCLVGMELLPLLRRSRTMLMVFAFPILMKPQTQTKLTQEENPYFRSF